VNFRKLQARRSTTSGPKYRNRKVAGYDSIAEWSRAKDLQLLERGGVISDLKEQQSFELVPKQQGERAINYVADFTYIENGQLVVEDVKGMRTALYILKRKLMKFIHGIEVKEIGGKPKKPKKRIEGKL